MNIETFKDIFENETCSEAEYAVYDAVVDDSHDNVPNFKDLANTNLRELSKALHRFGIEEFTCTSKASNMLGEWFELQEYGWKIDGMRILDEEWTTGRTREIPAFVFKEDK